MSKIKIISKNTVKKFLFNILLFLSLFLLIKSNGFSQEPAIHLTSDTNNVMIGEPVKIKLTYESEKQTNVIFPQIPDTIGKLEVIEKSKIDTFYNQNVYRLSQNITLTSYDSCDCEFPQFNIMYEKPGFTTLYPIQTPSLILKFNVPQIDTTKPIRDISPVFEEPEETTNWLPWIIAGIAIIALVLLIIFLIKKKRQSLIKKVIKIDLPPDTEALDALNKLESDNLWQNGHLKEYFIRLSEIIRYFIYRRYSIAAPELTTEETLSQMNKFEVEVKSILNLKLLLGIADLVKFAKHKSSPEECSSSIEMARSFIILNAPLPQQETDNLENAE